MGQIVEFPDEKNAKDKIQKLKKALENLVLEKDTLEYVVCENIKTEYMLAFGSLEYRIYKAYCKYLRLRRKKELIQIKKNRQEDFQMEDIENQLDEEFREYNKKLEEKIEEINAALKRSKDEVLTDKEADLIKKLYRDIVKRLHPDLNPSVTDAQKELFYNATDMYKSGDLDSLKIIHDIVCSEEKKDDVNLHGKFLQEEIKRLENLVVKIQDDIELTKSTPPYTWSVYFEDEKKKAEKLKELDQELKSFNEAIRTQEEYINDLMGNKK